MNTTIPASTTSVVPKVHIKKCFINTHRMFKVSPLLPHGNFLIIINGIQMSQLSMSLNPKVQKWWKKLKPRKQGGHLHHIKPKGAT